MDSGNQEIVAIPLAQLQPHPLNSNVMTVAARAKLKAHIARTGHYPPVIVRKKCRSANAECRSEDTKPPTDAGDSHAAPDESSLIRHSAFDIRHFEILDGHHRVAILRQLKHATARCVIWDVDDAEALTLLATLNRLQGQDDPRKRAELLAGMAQHAGVELRLLARQLPDTAAELARLRRLIQPPPRPVKPPDLANLPVAVYFFLLPGQRRNVEKRLAELGGPREEALLKGLGAVDQ